MWFFGEIVFKYREFVSVWEVVRRLLGIFRNSKGKGVGNEFRGF